MESDLIFIIFGIISLILSSGITILLVALPHCERKAERKTIEAKEAAEREERENRQRLVKALVDTAMDYDFGRDVTAGKETTSYKEIIAKAKEKAEQNK